MKLSKTSTYFISSFSFLFSFLYSAAPIFAVDIFPASTRAPRVTRVQERIEIRQENRQDRQELRTTIAQDRLILRRQNAIKIANNLVTKLEKRFEYLNKIKTRLQTKITSLKSSRNMNEAQAKLDTFNPTKYTTDLKALDSIIASIGTAEKPNSVIPALREASKLVLIDLKDLHQILVDTLKIMIKSPKITSIPTLSP